MDIEKCFQIPNFFNVDQILANERKILPLFTYFAALTRKLKAHPVMNDAKQVYVDLTNKSVHMKREAMKFY